MEALVILILIYTVKNTIFQERHLDQSMHGCTVVLAVSRNLKLSTNVGEVLNDHKSLTMNIYAQ